MAQKKEEDMRLEDLFKDHQYSSHKHRKINQEGEDDA